MLFVARTLVEILWRNFMYFDVVFDQGPLVRVLLAEMGIHRYWFTIAAPVWVSVCVG